MLSDVCEPSLLKFGMMIDTTKLYIYESGLSHFNFEGHRGARKQVFLRHSSISHRSLPTWMESGLLLGVVRLINMIIV